VPGQPLFFGDVMPGGRKSRGCEASVEDQEWFIRENAVSLVRARNEKIRRLRQQVTLLNKRVRALKAKR
jgi:hypothetical protein